MKVFGQGGPEASGPMPPQRQVRAGFDADHLTVYQAYRPEIADAAVAAGTFVAPFSLGRMTWIKPSFMWMMYRCGWATKPDQERVLAIRIARPAVDRALASSCLSHYDPAIHASRDEWQEQVRRTHVRVQWDPERSVDLSRLPWRAIQIGLSGEAAARYVREWIAGITDVTDLAHAVHRSVESGDLDEARSLVPVETPYPLPAHAARMVGISLRDTARAAGR